MNRGYLFLVGGTGVLMFAVLLGNSFAQEKSSRKTNDLSSGRKARVQNAKPKSGGSPSKPAQPVVEIDQATQVKLFKFVNEHHPEVTRLLESLEKERPRRYQQAMRQLAGSYERLQKLEREGKPKAYKEALEEWKLNSRIKLKAAEVAVKNTRVNREQLNALIAKRVDGRINSLRYEEQRLRNRLKNVVALLEKYEDRDREIQENMEAVMRTVSREFPNMKAGRGGQGEQARGRGSEVPPSSPNRKKQSERETKKSGKKLNQAEDGRSGN